MLTRSFRLHQQESGQGRGPLVRAATVTAEDLSAERPRVHLGWSALGVAAALVPGIAMWGFTVDDALVSVRYALSIASGAGYRFDPAGPVSDGVTPLPWAPLLALLAIVPPAAHDALALLGRARVLGLAAWTISAALLGLRVGALAASRGLRVTGVLALALVALAFPVGAWASSGMETGVVIALATSAAVAFPRARLAAALSGLAAAFRPELLPWSLTIGASSALASGQRARSVVGAAALSGAPFALTVGTRLAVFGRPAPLAVLAKPSDLSHGLVYAGAALVVVLLPLAAFAPASIARAGGRARGLAVAAVVHVLAVALAGGDWMPYARLLVPIVPSLALLVVEAAPDARAPRLARVGFVARLAMAFTLGALVATRAAPAGRGVYADRAALIQAARAPLSESRVVAALDVGWLSAATPARIVDLAGLTDETIAVLPGGHTSKRVDLGMLEARDVDTFVALEPPRVVEQRVLASPRFAEIFTRVATVPLGRTGTAYAVYRRPR